MTCCCGAVVAKGDGGVTILRVEGALLLVVAAGLRIPLAGTVDVEGKTRKRTTMRTSV